MLSELRESTAELHEQIEQENAAGRIMDHSISIDQYKNLLYQNYVAYAISEKEIAAQISGYEGEKHKALEKDLKQLDLPAKIPSFPGNEFYCNSEVEALGAAYVVEGSAMGGMLISRNLKKCDKLAPIENHYFFNGKRDSLKSWNEFKKLLNSRSFTEEEKASAINKAKETFEFFGQVFRQQFVLSK
ncbi:biliverdin-producing heme oxygenase [Salegentibacter sp. F188]|uniref:Biliverdin-producing heme oxygenase n=1 Tax=Autumnicola patrickiae TaxID=3075591 RepID=A0ABU3E1P6_9FLAO|nr:biliverdin-producing heme oxygenase [Salegentibacter sp. F188]MDT0689865.1 biliverdin-producing heme oxygenase [Salegentibacter sp. F188]